MIIPSKDSGRAVIGLVSVAAWLVLIIFALRFLPVPDTALDNQKHLVSMLRDARPIPAPGPAHKFNSVVLGERYTLMPEHEQVFVGYVLIAHTRFQSFTIEAKPVTVGETGLFSFFRDEQGVIRFQPQLGQKADENSRPWGGKAMLNAEQTRR